MSTATDADPRTVQPAALVDPLVGLPHRVRAVLRRAQDRLIWHPVDMRVQPGQGAGQSLIAAGAGKVLILTVDAPPAQLEAAAKRAQEVYTRAKGGEDFAKLAVAYSNSQTALDGGALGWRKGSELPTFLTESIAKLKPGEVSEPLRTPTGYHIIRLNEVRGGTENAVEDQVHVRHILMKTTELADDATVRSKLEALRERILKGEEFAGIAQVSSEDPGSAAEGGDLGWTGPGTFAPEFEQAIGRLKDKGPVTLWTPTAPAFGTRPFTEGPTIPPARNPVDKSRTAGGSSGGAAAAVAAGLCALSHGGDGGGSIRIPASCCGVVGRKPSRGRISSGPLFGEDWAGLATSGVIARTVADAALGLDAMSGHLPGDPYWAEIPEPFLRAAERKPATLRVGWTIDAPAPVDPEVAAAVERVAAELARLGHRVSRVSPDLSGFRPLIQILAVTAVGALPIADLELLDPLNRRMLQGAPISTAVDYLKALTELHQQARRLIASWDRIDVLLTPTLTYPAPKIGAIGQNVETASGEFLDWLSFTHPFNGTGQPAISLPLATSKAGLPIGIQLVKTATRCLQNSLRQ